MAKFKDYYQVLGIAKDASEQDVRRAFRKLAAQHHPDRNPDDPGAEERFKELNEAYTVLADPEKRAVYDRYGAEGPRAAGVPGGGFGGGTRYYTNVRPEDAAGFSDFFRSLFGGGFGAPDASFEGAPFGGAPFGRSAAAPRPVEASLGVALERAYRGGPVSVRVDGRALEVTLPEGVRDGAKLRLRGQGPGGADLVLVVRHEPHPRWKLHGDQLVGSVDVPDHVAVLGGHVRVATLDGDVEVTVPPHTAAGRRLRLRGRGWPVAAGGRGDALAEVRIVVPDAVSDVQRQAYERLRDLAREGAREPASDAG